MAEKTAVENETISNFQGLVTLTLDWVIPYTVVHHSLTSTYTPNFAEIEETSFVDGWTYIRKKGRTCETHFSRSTQRVDLKTMHWLLLRYPQTVDSRCTKLLQHSVSVFIWPRQDLVSTQRNKWSKYGERLYHRGGRIFHGDNVMWHTWHQPVRSTAFDCNRHYRVRRPQAPTLARVGDH